MSELILHDRFGDYIEFTPSELTKDQLFVTTNHESEGFDMSREDAIRIIEHLRTEFKL